MDGTAAVDVPAGTGAKLSKWALQSTGVRALAVGVAALAASLWSAATADAYTYVAQCNAANWPSGRYCPSTPIRSGTRSRRGVRPRELVPGISTSSGTWPTRRATVAPPAKKAAEHHFHATGFGTAVGNTLYSPMSGNNELLRAYTYTSGNNGGNLYSEGGY